MFLIQLWILVIFQKNSNLYDNSKEKVIGYLKEEFGGQPIIGIYCS